MEMDIPGRDEDGEAVPTEPALSIDIATSWYPTIRFGLYNKTQNVEVFLTPIEARAIAAHLEAAADYAERRTARR